MLREHDKPPLTGRSEQVKSETRLSSANEPFTSLFLLFVYVYVVRLFSFWVKNDTNRSGPIGSGLMEKAFEVFFLFGTPNL